MIADESILFFILSDKTLERRPIANVVPFKGSFDNTNGFVSLHDCKVNRLALRLVLKCVGREDVEEANDGIEAVEKARERLAMNGC